MVGKGIFCGHSIADDKDCQSHSTASLKYRRVGFCDDGPLNFHSIALEYFITYIAHFGFTLLLHTGKQKLAIYHELS